MRESRAFPQALELYFTDRTNILEISTSPTRYPRSPTPTDGHSEKRIFDCLAAVEELDILKQNGEALSILSTLRLERREFNAQSLGTRVHTTHTESTTRGNSQNTDLYTLTYRIESETYDFNSVKSMGPLAYGSSPVTQYNTHTRLPTSSVTELTQEEIELPHLMRKN